MCTKEVIFEDFIQLSPVQQKIFDKVKTEWEKRVGKGKISDGKLKRMILFADRDGDGKKRVTSIRTGKTYLIPIADIILWGLDESEIDKYPVEKK